MTNDRTMNKSRIPQPLPAKQGGVGPSEAMVRGRAGGDLQATNLFPSRTLLRSSDLPQSCAWER